MARLSFANLTAGDGPLKSQQLLAEFHHLFPQLVLDVGLLADPSFRSNQSGDQTVFGFSAESSDFRVQRRSVSGSLSWYREMSYGLLSRPGFRWPAMLPVNLIGKLVSSDRVRRQRHPIKDTHGFSDRGKCNWPSFTSQLRDRRSTWREFLVFCSPRTGATRSGSVCHLGSLT